MQLLHSYQQQWSYKDNIKLGKWQLSLLATSKVRICMHASAWKGHMQPLKKAICLNTEKPNKPQPVFFQESDLHTADLREGGQRRKLWVVPTSLPLTHTLPGGNFASCWQQLLECSRFSASVRWAENCSHLDLLHQHSNQDLSQKSEERMGGRRQPKPGPLFFKPLSFFSSFLILYVEVRALRQGKTPLCGWGQQSCKYDPQCASEQTYLWGKESKTN